MGTRDLRVRAGCALGSARQIKQLLLTYTRDLSEGFLIWLSETVLHSRGISSHNRADVWNSTDNSSMKVVGRLVRSYREDSTHGGGYLSRDVLLYLITAHREIGKDGNTLNYSHSDLSRWESGESVVPKEFLEDFCTALEISKPESDEMLDLLSSSNAGSNGTGSDRNPVTAMMNSSFGKIMPPGGYTSLGGFSFGALGFNGTESLLAYVGGLLALVTGLGVWRWRKSGETDEVIDDLFFVSLLFLLNTPLLLGAVTRVDPYGLFALPAFEVGAFLFMLVIIINLTLSLAAWYLFIYLRRWFRSEENRRRLNPYMRSVGITLPPIISVYAFILLFGNLGGWIFYLAILGTLFAAFTVILAFSAPDIHWSERKVKWATPVVLQVIVILCLVGIASMLVAYIEPSLIVETDRRNFIWSWESGFESLRFSENELIERFQVGVVWMSLAAIAYLTIIVGSYVVVTVRRHLGGAESRK